MNGLPSHAPYEHERHADGSVTFASRQHVFIRFRERWQFYVREPTGDEQGLQRFVCYVTQPAHIATLEHAARVAELGIA